jgi:glycosyltransferase involved in cell wall biosynthesis
MKICYIGWADYIHLKRWAEWFAIRGHQIDVITDRPDFIKGVKIHKISSEMKFNLRVKEVKNLLRKIKPDILHLHTSRYPAYLGYFSGFSPLVVTFWNGDILWDTMETPAHRFLNREIIRKADLITVDSKKMIDICLRLKSTPNKIFLIQWGVDLNHFNPGIDISEIKNRLNPEGYPIVLSPRNMTEGNNIDSLIKVIPLILKRIPKVKFIFIWHALDGLYYSRINQLIAKYRVKKNICLVGRITDYPKMADYYTLADVSVSVSSYDSTPVSLLEAMACGAVPVISNLPSIREWIKDDENGYLVHPRNIEEIAEAIIKLLKDKKKRELFAKRNLLLIKQNADHNEEMKKMEGLYLKLLKNRKKFFYNSFLSHYSQGLGFNLEDNNTDKAEKKYEEAISSNSNLPEAYFLLSKLKEKKGKIKDAISFCQKSIELDHSSEYFVFLGELYDSIERKEEALKNFKAAIKIDPDNIDAWAWLKAYEIIEKKIEIETKNIYYDPRGYSLIVAILLKKGFPIDKVIKIFQKLINYYPLTFSADDYCHLVYALNRFYEKNDISKYLLKEAFKCDTNHIIANYYLGLDYKERKIYKEAIKLFRKLYKLESFISDSYTRARFRFHLGTIYKELNEKEKAKYCFEECLKLVPDHKKAKEFLEQL